MVKQFLFSISTVAIIFSGCTPANNRIDTSTLTELQKQQLYKTSLHEAVRINDLEKVKEILAEGKDINSKDRFGYTPLHLAARFNHYDIANYLIEHGAEVNSKDKYGDSALIDTTRNGYTNLSKLLICNGAKRDILDKYGMSALHYASKVNDVLIAKILRAKDIEPLCNNTAKKQVQNKEQFYNLITIDDYNVINSASPKICGDILDLDVRQVQITFDGGRTVTNAKLDDKRWCAIPSEKIKNGNYNVMAMAINSARQKGLVKDDLIIKVENMLSNTLKKEFENDLEKWNAQFDEESLTIRFKNPSALFERGSIKIQDRFKNILDSFLPRYINILKDYKSKISSVHIEGHTSSRYRSASTDEEKFEKNKVLSQKRADLILKYLNENNDPLISENLNFIKEKFIAIGKSSSELIYKEDGSEDYDLSRRVEFKIESK